MANEAQVRELEEACAAIMELASRKGSFIKRPEWGEINFEYIEKDIETLFWIVEQIRKLLTDILPQGIVEDSTACLNEARDTFNNIDAFTISHGDPSSSRDSLANELSSNVQQIISGIGTWLPLLAFHAGEIENWTSRIKDRTAETTRFLQEAESHITAQKEQIDESVRAARAAAGEAGAAEFTDEFRREAAAREKRSRRWLYPTALFSALALSLSVLVMFGWLGKTPTNVWEAVYGLGGRVIAISVLFYAAVWSGRIALANMNLASVNKHRAVSLQTLQAFHKSAEDPAAKDAVVLEAARARSMKTFQADISGDRPQGRVPGRERLKLSEAPTGHPALPTKVEISYHGVGRDRLKYTGAYRRVEDCDRRLNSPEQAG